MKAKINGIEVEGTPQEVAELAKMLEAKVEGKPKVDYLEVHKNLLEQQKRNYIPHFDVLRFKDGKADWQYRPELVTYTIG